MEHEMPLEDYLNGGAQPASLSEPVPEVSTSEAAKLLGVSRDVVLAYRAEGLLPYRNVSPPSSSRPSYRYPREAVMRLRNSYGTEATQEPVRREKSRRQVKGEPEYQCLRPPKDYC